MRASGGTPIAIVGVLALAGLALALNLAAGSFDSSLTCGSERCGRAVDAQTLGVGTATAAAAFFAFVAASAFVGIRARPAETTRMLLWAHAFVAPFVLFKMADALVRQLGCSRCLLIQICWAVALVILVIEAPNGLALKRAIGRLRFRIAASATPSLLLLVFVGPLASGGVLKPEDGPIELRAMAWPRLSPAGDVRVVVFTDYACAYCRECFLIMQRLARQSTGVQITMVGCPPEGADPRSVGGRTAAMAVAASRKGVFAEYAAATLAEREGVSHQSLDELGRRWSLTIEESDWDVVAAGVEEAERLGIRKVPTVFVNGMRVERWPTVELAVTNARERGCAWRGKH